MSLFYDSQPISQHKRHQSYSKRLKRPQISYENQHRFKELLCPKASSSLKRPDYLHEDDIPGARPKVITPLKGKDYLNISDIDGTQPKKPPLYHVAKNLILDVSDINGKVRERIDPRTVINVEDCHKNFSNPHLGKPSWCHNMLPKVNLRTYKMGEAPIQQVLFPDRATDYERVKSKALRLPPLSNVSVQTDSRPDSIRRSVLSSNRVMSKQFKKEEANLSMDSGTRQAEISSRFEVRSNRGMLLREEPKATNDYMEPNSKYSRRSVNRTVDLGAGTDREIRVPSSQRTDIPYLDAFKPPRPAYTKMNIDKMYL